MLPMTFCGSDPGNILHKQKSHKEMITKSLNGKLLVSKTRTIHIQLCYP